MSGGAVPDPLATLPVMTLHQHRWAHGQEGLRSPAKPLHYCLLLHIAGTLFSTGRATASQREKISQKERDCTSLFFSLVRKGSRKMRRGGEAARWLLSGITSVGAVLQHYRSKPLCLCLSLTCRHTHTHAHAGSQHTSAHRRASTMHPHAQLDRQIGEIIFYAQARIN